MKHNRLTACLIPLAAILCACGGGTSSSGATSVASSSAEASSASSAASSAATSAASSSASGAISSIPVGEEVTISFWSTGSQGLITQLKALASEFETKVKNATGETVHVEITVEGSYDDIAAKISKGLTVGNIPNMAVAYPDTVANILAKEAGKEYLYDLEPYFEDANIGFGTQSYLGDTEEAGREDIIPSFLDEGTHYAREGTFSYPFMKSSEVMFYKVDEVERAYSYYKPAIKGAENIRKDLLAMDWEEFENLLTSVKENKEKILNTLETPAWYDSDSNWFISQMYQREIPYTSITDGVSSIDFESGENRAAAEAMVTDFKGLYDDGLITTKGVENLYGSYAFADGQVLFEIGSSGGTGYNMPEGLNPEDIGIVPVPAAEGNKAYVSQGPTITFLKNPTISSAENDKQMYYAWQFAKYLTNPAANVRLCIRGSEGYIPIRYSAYEDADYIDFLEEPSIYATAAKVLINEISNSYYNAPVFPGSAELRDLVGGIIGDVFKGTKQVTQAFDDAIDKAKTYMK